MKNKTIIILIIGLLVFTTLYTLVIFKSNFGIPNTIDWVNNYPCKSGFSKINGGYVFENCYVLKLWEVEIIEKESKGVENGLV